MRYVVRSFMMVALMASVYVVWTLGATVEFADPNLEMAVREAIGKETGAIETSDVAGLESLDCRGLGIQDISGIEHCTDLTTLTLWINAIEDITPLAQLSKLVYLDLDENLVRDVSPLASLSSLRLLYLSWNPIEDLSPLAQLASLEALFLNDVGDLNWSALSTSLSLQTLAAARNGIRDITQFAGFPMLCKLELRDNEISDLSSLGTSFLAMLCPDGSYLGLRGNEIEDFSALSPTDGVGFIHEVDLRGNPGITRGIDDETQVLIEEIGDRGGDVLYLEPLEAGVMAPDFTLENLLADEEVTLSALRGTVVIIDFWASWCGPCRATMPDVEALALEFAPDVVLLGINLDQVKSNATDFLDQNPLDGMTVLWSSFAEANAVSIAYGDLLQNGIPHTFVIDRRGEIAFSGHPLQLDSVFLQLVVGR